MVKKNNTEEDHDDSPTQLPIAQMGYNCRRFLKWRARLKVAVDETMAREKMGFRPMANRAIDQYGQPMAHTTLMNAIQGRGTINVDTLIAVCDAVNVDAVHVLLGENYTRAGLPKGGEIKFGTEVKLLRIVPSDEAKLLLSPPTEPLRAEELTTAPPGTVGAIRMVDNSMAPTFNAGDVLYFSDDEPKNGDIVVVGVEGSRGTSVRKYRRTKDEKIELTALDNDYGRQTLAESKVEILGVVVGSLTSV